MRVIGIAYVCAVGPSKFAAEPRCKPLTLTFAPPAGQRRFGRSQISQAPGCRLGCGHTSRRRRQPLCCPYFAARGESHPLPQQRLPPPRAAGHNATVCVPALEIIYCHLSKRFEDQKFGHFWLLAALPPPPPPPLARRQVGRLCVLVCARTWRHKLDSLACSSTLALGEPRRLNENPAASRPTLACRVGGRQIQEARRAGGEYFSA